MKLLSLVSALLALGMVLATPAFCSVQNTAAEQQHPPANLTPSHVLRIDCGNVSGSAWAVTDHVLVTAYHVTSKATVSCTLPATGETAYIASEDKTADIAFLHVEQPLSYHFTVDCSGYPTGETFYGAGWPREGFTITEVKASEYVMDKAGFWWNQQIFYGPQEFESGESGGPVVDAQGHVHGLVNGRDPRAWVNESYSRSLADTILCRGQ